MQRMSHRLRSLRGGSGLDRGGVAVMVSVLLASGVLFGFGALVVDVGSIFAERREVQTSADAGALALAQECASNGPGCSASSTIPAAFADANATDGFTGVDSICIRTNGSSCAGGGTGLTNCLPLPAGVTHYVEVQTSTRTKGGQTILPSVFAETLTPGISGANVKACSRAAWGPPKTNTGLAVTLSICEWDSGTGGGSAYFTGPAPYLGVNQAGGPNPPVSYEIVIKLHTTTSTTCPDGPAGSNAPGGFSWLDEDAGPCQASISAGGTIGGDPGVPPSKDCKDALLQAYTDRVPLPLPVFNTVSGTGSNTVYGIAGVSEFVVTGYNLPGASKDSWLTGGVPKSKYCKGSDKCIYGFFTTGLIPGSGQIGGSGSGFGASIVQLVG